MKPAIEDAIEGAKFLIALPVIVAFAWMLGIIALLTLIFAILRETARWVWHLCAIAWIARGEPDARCDAEKDGGGM